jgi:hypothetical protein
MSETQTPASDLAANTPVEGGEQPIENTAPPAPEPAKPQHPDWRDRRFANITRQRAEEAERARQATERADRLEAELSRLRQGGQQPDGQQDSRQQQDPREIERQAEQRATERLRQEQVERTFIDACNQTAERIKADFGDTGLSVAASGWNNAGLDLAQPNHRELLSLITSIEDGHKVYHSIGTDPNLAAHLLELPPLRAAFELAQYLPAKQARELRQEAVAVAEAEPAPAAAQLTATAPKPAPTISSAPRPPSQPAATRAGSAGSSDLSKMSMAEFAAARAKQRASGA